MAYKIFLDVNVLLDFFLKRKDYENAKRILFSAKNSQIKLYVSPSIIQTVSYFLQKNFDTNSCKNLLLELLKLVNVIETSQETIKQALNYTMDDIEDAILYFTALAHKMDCLVSSDIEFQKVKFLKLPIISVEELTKKLA